MPDAFPIYTNSLQKICIYFVLDGSNVSLAYYELTNLIQCSFYNSQKILSYSSLKECIHSRILVLQVSTVNILPELININRYLVYTLTIGIILFANQVDFTKQSDENLSVLLTGLEKNNLIIKNWITNIDSFKVTLLTIGDFARKSLFSKNVYYHWIPSVGKKLATITDAIIDLENYFHHIEFIANSSGGIILGFQLFQVNRRSIEQRSPKHREFFHPASMNSFLIRGMINLGLTPALLQQLTHVKNNCTFLDPFMGGGGFILDALDIGFNTFGIDLNSKMSGGTQINIKNFESRFAFRSLPWVLFHADSKHLPLKKNTIDLIVSDPPYGNNSSLMKIPLIELLNSVLSECLRVLKPNSRIVLCVPSKYSLPAILLNQKLITTIEVPVHRSLTRIIWVIEKHV